MLYCCVANKKKIKEKKDSDLKFVDAALNEMFTSDRKRITDSLAFFVSVNKFLSISIVVATVAEALGLYLDNGF